MKLNILFSCAGRRNYLINYFRKALNGNGLVIATDYQLNAPALIDADIAFKVPDIYDDMYIPRLKEIIKEYNVNAVISLNDLELPIISKHKQELENLNTKVIISNEDVIDISFDKWKTYQFLKKIGLNTPETFKSLDSAIKAIEQRTLKFPLVIKPRWGSGSIAIEYPESLEELKIGYKLQKFKINRTILNTVNSQAIEDASFVKEKIAMRSGETDKARSVINEDFEKLGEIIGSKLKHIGNMDVDAFKMNDKLFILELNPRFGGGYPFSHQAGANITAVYLDWLKGHSDHKVKKHIDYKENITFSKCDRLIKVYNKNDN